MAAIHIRTVRQWFFNGHCPFRSRNCLLSDLTPDECYPHWGSPSVLKGNGPLLDCVEDDTANHLLVVVSTASNAIMSLMECVKVKTRDSVTIMKASHLKYIWDTKNQLDSVRLP